MEEVPGNSFGEILISKEGYVLVSCTDFSYAMISGAVFTPFNIGLSKTYQIKNIKNVFYNDPMLNIVESNDHNIFFSNSNNQISFFKNTETGYCDLPPFYFPPKGETNKIISQLWFDIEDNLYIAVKEDAFYIVPKAGKNASLDSNFYKTASTKDSMLAVLKGELMLKKVLMDSANGVYSFGQNRINKTIIWIGTGNGLFTYNSKTGAVVKIFAPPLKTTITHIEPLATGDIWFSTLERGMGVYHPKMKNIIFYLYKKQAASDSSLRPIQNFYIKSSSEFFVAVKDSFPAIFNTSNGRYKFITDPLNGLHFTKTRNSTTDIKVDSSGNFYFIKGGMLYSANIAAFPEWLGETKSTQISTPLIYQITDLNKRLIADYYTNSGRLKQLTLNHNQTSIIVYFTSNNFKADKRTEFAWKLEGSNINYWYELPGISNNNDSSHIAELANLNPGKYKFRVKMRIQGEPWDANEAELAITVLPPYWSTLWFWSLVIGGLALLGYLVVKIRVITIKKSEKVKLNYEKHLIELEAKALRSQMNPHFVFNCLNSIKALMQDNDTEKGVNYLTTFSKLIRTLFNNADKKEITLYDEIETCKYYLQLEAMRFDTKFSYIINVSHEIDLKSIYIPALIIQPFIENAIWHGIIPKPGGGNVTLSVLQQTNAVEIIIEDDGIGREASAKSRTKADIGHQSKGVNLTQSRLELDNLLRQRFASIKTVDKFDNEGKATGTKVIVSLPLEE